MWVRFEKLNDEGVTMAFQLCSQRCGYLREGTSPRILHLSQVPLFSGSCFALTTADDARSGSALRRKCWVGRFMSGDVFEISSGCS